MCGWAGGKKATHKVGVMRKRSGRVSEATLASPLPAPFAETVSGRVLGE